MKVDSLNAPPDPAIEKSFADIRLATAKRHVLLCVGPNCCATAEGLATWDFLKRKLAELEIPALRSKVACLRICRGGPWLVVYPEGIWYGSVNPERCARIVEEHLLRGQPVADWVVKRQPFDASPDDPAPTRLL